jgi:predicted enzyme related to lactoylglutathione lyase
MHDMKRIKGIGGIFFKARDHANLRKWYEDHFGIPASDHGFSFPWRSAENPDQTGMTVWSIFPQTTKYFGEANPAFMINYIVDDLDRAIEELRAEGVAVEDKVEAEYGRFAWVTDPEGNRIELWEPPPES